MPGSCAHRAVRGTVNSNACCLCRLPVRRALLLALPATATAQTKQPSLAVLGMNAAKHFWAAPEGALRAAHASVRTVARTAGAGAELVNVSRRSCWETIHSEPTCRHNCLEQQTHRAAHTCNAPDAHTCPALLVPCRAEGRAGTGNVHPGAARRAGARRQRRRQAPGSLRHGSPGLQPAQGPPPPRIADGNPAPARAGRPALGGGALLDAAAGVHARVHVSRSRLRALAAAAAPGAQQPGGRASGQQRLDAQHGAPVQHAVGCTLERAVATPPSHHAPPYPKHALWLLTAAETNHTWFSQVAGKCSPNGAAGPGQWLARTLWRCTSTRLGRAATSVVVSVYFDGGVVRSARWSPMLHDDTDTQSQGSGQRVYVCNVGDGAASCVLLAGLALCACAPPPPPPRVGGCSHFSWVGGNQVQLATPCKTRSNIITGNNPLVWLPVRSFIAQRCTREQGRRKTLLPPHATHMPPHGMSCRHVSAVCCWQLVCSLSSFAVLRRRAWCSVAPSRAHPGTHVPPTLVGCGVHPRNPYGTEHRTECRLFEALWPTHMGCAFPASYALVT